MTESLFRNIDLGTNAQNVDASPQWDAYSGVEIIVSDTTSFFAGRRTGRVLTVENAWGSQQQANNILASLRSTGFQYQPIVVTGAILDPAAELGDGVIANGIHSGIYNLSRNFGPLMVATVEAPQDEELDHEYPYQPKQDRIYKREIASAKAEIGITADRITAEVIRATEAEGSLASQITQTATDISATVSRKLETTGGSSSSFGWTLTDSAWELKSNGSTVFKVTSSGAEVSGRITATSGYIGTSSDGFSISAHSIYNGMNNVNDTTHNGIYVGTDGIALGKGAFKVTSTGSVSASNMSLSGTLTVGGATITASDLRQGAERANTGYASWDSAATSVSTNGSYWSSGAGYGYDFNLASLYNTSDYPSYFTCGTLWARSGIVATSMSLGGQYLSLETATISGKTIAFVGWGYE